MKQTVREAKQRLSVIYRHIANEPEVLDAEIKLQEVREAVAARYKRELDAATADLHNAQRVKAPPPAMPALLVPVIARLNRGVDWNGKWRVYKLSSEHDRAIIGLPNRVCWSGIGQRSVVPAEQHLIDLKRVPPDKGYAQEPRLLDTISVARNEGRLTVFKRAEWDRWCNGGPLPL